MPGEHDDLVATFSTAGVKSIALIDDCFDDPVLGVEDRGQVMDLLTDVEEEFTKATGINVPDDPADLNISALVEAFESETNRREFAEIWGLLSAHLNRADKELGPFLKVLDALVDVDCARLRSEDKIPANVQLLFMDFLLNDEGQRFEALTAALMKREELPAVIVMSENPTSQSASEEVRKAKSYFGGLFNYIGKEELNDPFLAKLHLNRILGSLPATSLLNKVHVALRSDAVTDAIAAARNDLCALRLDDYAFLEDRALREDGQPLGEYVSWLFSSHVLAEVVEKPLRGLFAQLDTHPLNADNLEVTEPGTLVAKMFSNAQVTPATPLAPHPRGGSDPYLLTGDVFLRHGEDTKKGDDEVAGKQVLGVLSPACDLAYAPGTRRKFPGKLAVQLAPGTLQPTTQNGGYFDVVVKIDDEYKKVVWEENHVFSVPYNQISSWLCSRGFKRTFRLRDLYALGLQRSAFAKLARVGVPVALPRAQKAKVIAAPPWAGNKKLEIEDGASVTASGVEFKRTTITQLRQFLLDVEQEAERLPNKERGLYTKTLDAPPAKWTSAFVALKLAKGTKPKRLQGLPFEVSLEDDGTSFDWTTTQLLALLVVPA